MMSSYSRVSTYCLLGLILGVTSLVVLKGCRQDQYPHAPAHPAGFRQPTMQLRIASGTELQAKAVGLTVEAEALDDAGNLTGDTITPMVLTDLTFPLAIPLEFFIPPCDYQFTLTLAMSRDVPRVMTFAADVCERDEIAVVLDTFEELIILSTDPIDAPASVNAGDPIEVRCGPIELSAPDIDRAQPRATLQEEDGNSVDGPIDGTNAVGGIFPDPYPLSSPETQRVFTCFITDEQAKSGSFTTIVERIVPTPTPTATPTATPTSTPTAVPTSTPTGFPTP